MTMASLSIESSASFLVRNREQRFLNAFQEEASGTCGWSASEIGLIAGRAGDSVGSRFPTIARAQADMFSGRSLRPFCDRRVSIGCRSSTKKLACNRAKRLTERLSTRNFACCKTRWAYSLPTRCAFLRDDRRPAACDQIADHLLKWDGTLYLGGASSGATDGLRLWIHVRPKGPELKCGLIQRCDGNWRRIEEAGIAEVIQQPRYLSRTTHKAFRPLRTDGITLFRYDGEYWFDSRQIYPGDRFFLLIPWHRRDVWEREILPWKGRGGHKYCATRQLADSTWTRLSGLPNGWALFEGSLPAELSHGDVRGELGRLVRVRPLIRCLPGSGLQLARNVWMEGAGPTLEVVGGKGVKTVWINSEPHSLDAQGRLDPAAAPVLDHPGFYSAHPEDLQRVSIRFRVKRPNLKPELADEAGWRRKEDGWPEQRLPNSLEKDELAGPKLVGDWPAQEVPATGFASLSEEQQWLALARRFHGVPAPFPAKDDLGLETEPSNLLVRQLLRTTEVVNASGRPIAGRHFPLMVREAEP